MMKGSLTPEELRATQLVELDMLIEVDRICRGYGINYSLAGGTLLGAVRHKGFIPWDDDADIVLLREEYEKLAAVFPKASNNSKYYFQDSTNTVGYRWGFGKIRRKNSLWVRKDQEHLPFKQEISIDIFPLDKVPYGKMRAQIHNFQCFIIRKMMWSEVGKYTDKSHFVRFLLSLASKIPLRNVLEYYNRFAKKNNTDKNTLLRVLTFPTPKGFTFEGKAEWYSEYTEMIFEGYNFRVMRGYIDYLKLKYGDYMVLPPESERKNSNHQFSEFRLPKGE
jgi:lipopolysaccharide cholinephosphotransferase